MSNSINQLLRNLLRSSFARGATIILFYVVALILAAFVEIALARLPANKNWIRYLVVIVGILFFFAALEVIDSIGLLIRKKLQEAAQAQRDYAAEQMCRALADRNSPTPTRAPETSFYLFLRPFTSTGDVKIVLQAQLAKRTSANIVTYDYGEFGRTWRWRLDVIWGDLETELSMLFGQDLPLLALGRPGEQIGAGRVQSTEDSWRTDLQLLAESADGILVIPSTHEGTKWEIANLMENRKLIRKCIFIVPPEVSMFGSPYAQGPAFKFGALPKVPDGTGLRKDAIDALTQFGIDQRGLDRIRENPWGTLVRLGLKGGIVAERPLLVYYDAHLSFYSLVWFLRSILWGKMKKLSRPHLVKSLRNLLEARLATMQAGLREP
jgi:hypothetical protein